MLAASGLSNRQQSFTIINALTGAARRSFFRAYELNFDTTTPVATSIDVLNKLVALVPDHKAMCNTTTTVAVYDLTLEARRQDLSSKASPGYILFPA